MIHEKKRVRGMNVHVHVGPSCPDPVIRERYPEVVVKAPVKHGDLYSPSLGSGDTVVILDGLYHHHLAMRHKEVLYALSRGITVIGAASIGALRAVELSSYGMTGVGEVYSWYRDGVFDGDDAVAVAHADSGSSATALNIPLVNVYAALVAAVREGVLGREAADRLLIRCERQYYPQRTHHAVMKDARQSGLHEFAHWYSARTSADPWVFDQKRADCLQALDVARAGSLTRGAAPSAGPSPLETAVDPSPADADRDWRTEFERRWRNTFAEDLHHRFVYQQIFRRRFPRTWWRYLNQVCPGPAYEPDLRLRDHVISTLGEPAAAWTVTGQGRDRLTRLICPTPDLTDPHHSALLLSEETPEDRSTGAGYLAATAAHLRRRPGRSLKNISDHQCLRLLAGLWHTSDLATECGRRGFQSPRHATNSFKPFVIGFLSATMSAAGPQEPARA